MIVIQHIETLDHYNFCDDKPSEENSAVTPAMAYGQNRPKHLCNPCEVVYQDFVKMISKNAKKLYFK